MRFSSGVNRQRIPPPQTRLLITREIQIRFSHTKANKYATILAPHLSF